jgi:hypothetical protein
MLNPRLSTLHATVALLLLVGQSSCTRIVMNQVGDGEACFSDAQCTPPLLCVEQVCQSGDAITADASSSGDAQAGAGDAEGADVHTEVRPRADASVVTGGDSGSGDTSSASDADGFTASDGGGLNAQDGDVTEPSDTDIGAGGTATGQDTQGDGDAESDVTVPGDIDSSAAQDVADNGAGEVSTEDVEGSELAELGDPCTGICAPGLICLPQGDGSALCANFPEGVCAPCEQDQDCPTLGAACLENAQGERFCGAPCGNDSDCPTGFDCGEGSQCAPWTQSCSCTAGLLGATLGCENQGADGLCTGVMICQLDGWSKCSAKPPTAELCDGIDNDCDGFIDEQPYYIENGKQLAFGSLCGIGQCQGGEVLCKSDGSATCSTLGLATSEACADNEDNDCDGQVNEDCDSLDWDGDGVPNALDCAPMDSAKYQGAPEPCCPANAALDGCDLNCDGAALACAGCDLDGDGSCPPEDCNDLDPNIFPGAPEKCNDGVDQDCQGGDIVCNPAVDKDNDDWIPPADCNEGNPAVHPLAPELCDNLDNDCDGLTDEGNPQAGQPCGTTDDYCQAGQMVCTHYPFGSAIHCQGTILFEPERCDGIDNDCSGGIDEPFIGLGEACDGPDIDLCANGSRICLGDGSGTVCGDESVTNLYEVCNGIDDDCNGATDEFVCPLYDLDADGMTADQGDCDDTDAARYPGAPEPCCDPAFGASGATLCDLNCDGIVTPCALTDLDADGYTEGQGDCDDGDAHTHPGAIEKCGDGLDQDCVGGDLPCETVSDNDGDGFHTGVDCNDTDHTVNPWAKEDCNYIDEDCDGQIDEGNPTGQVGSCGLGVAECPPGEWVCVHDGATSTVQVLCVNDKFQAPELCNGLDDDCDGEVDEVFFDLGMPCDGPDSDQCEFGVMVCSDDGSGLVCGPEAPSGVPEICDTLDNDCDGSTDEGVHYKGIGLGNVCEGEGLCGPGIVQCTVIGATTCSTHADGAFSQAAPETCNSGDDDCDGSVDEDFLYQGVAVGQPCQGIGACGSGVAQCWGVDATICSTQPGGVDDQSTAEVCDGSDNNCDGHVDEGLTVSDSPCGQQGVCSGGDGDAECKAGEWLCYFDSVSEWQLEETLCDGLDNDCDGVTDEGWLVGQACDGDDSDSCALGTWTCLADGSSAACLNETSTNLIETCNALDDDCDGVTDELDISPIDAGCLQGGVCSQTESIFVLCDDEGVICDYSAVPDHQIVELACDGQDNDCDGLTDEALTLDGQSLGAGCDGQGACGPGVVQCHPSDGTLMCSTGPGGANDESVAESCNAVDDDCDGLTDEAFSFNDSPIGAECPAIGVCGPGVVECLPNGTPGCSSGDKGSSDQASAEVCNALDDDCDGETDELSDLNLEDAGCTTTGVCADVGDVTTCEGGGWMCHYELLESWQSSEDICDDLDNDCDGDTDEHLPLKGAACDGPDLDQCETGSWSCGPTGLWLVCTNEPGPVQVELCDGVDNDCDGVIDNDISYQGQAIGAPCEGVGVCGAGVVECGNASVGTCSTNSDGSTPEHSIESCGDALDNDCDGETDEEGCQ